MADVMTGAWRSVTLPALRRLVLPCLFAGLVAVGGYLRVPIPGNPVPLTLQVVFVLLAGAFMAPGAAAASMALFLAAGVLGAPVFAGAGAGFGYLAGPTGGYLLGFVAGATLGSLIIKGRRDSLPRTVFGMSVALLVIHLLGLLHLGLYLGGDLATAASYDAPFAAADLLKLAAAAAVAVGSAAVMPRAE